MMVVAVAAATAVGPKVQVQEHRMVVLRDLVMGPPLSVQALKPQVRVCRCPLSFALYSGYASYSFDLFL